MKKLFITLASILFFVQTAFATDIEIVPTMQTISGEQDKVWVGTFQLVWNDFMDKYIFDTVKFVSGTPEIVKELNKQEFTVKDINEKCFYKYTGKITKNTKKIITKAIAKKFNETSDILSQLDLTPAPNRFIIYAMLKKDFQFTHAFDKLGKSDFRGEKAEFFGINKRSNEQLRDGVRVLFYNSPSDYAVVLNTVDEDEVFLYRTSGNRPFDFIYKEMQKKGTAFDGKTYFTDKDELKVPNIKFFKEKSFEELAGQRVKGTQYQIEKALETVKFDMNNEGVKLKSEAAMTVKLTSVGPGYSEKPRHFYYNDTFVIFLKEKNKTIPYFALRVHDIKKFQ